ncbi:haloacid dehalogenase-like hydrolase [Leptospira fainei serovar Hurstbridge str. BUT 6]|uniref:Haloacid dehalogenase-like hydrolase n=1 Tax=Leptospira fainei serovar Hurstbridge str. BUT 6 TaxID=1193011 RepID=S3V2W8_9LEPT|nr:haloacid dehalogenase [Leptospira fainei]EPG75793.1 haloacid dehalogenase-like hydrolase [Leptospira fainei serovar Hurstbridge str. BUT 6]
MRSPLFVFDLMDTLIKDPFHTALKALLSKDQLESFRNGRERQAFLDFEKGQITEEEFFSRFYLESHRNAGLPSPQELKERMFSSVHPIQESFQIVKTLKEKGFQVLLASNYSVWYKELLQFPEVGSLLLSLDRLYFSCEMGVRKPAQEYYQWIQTDYPDREYVFVDDNATNVEVAGYLNWNAFRFDPKNPGELRNFLIEQFPNCL